MPRPMTDAMKSALAAGVVYPVFFYDAQFKTGWVHLWTGRGDRVFNATTYQGIGWVVGISEVEEADQVVSTQVDIGFRGTDIALVQIALGEVYRNAPGTVWFGMRDPSSGALIDTPIKAFEGRLAIALLDSDPAKPTIAIRYQSRVADLLRPRVRRYTDADQQQQHKGDLFFQHVANVDSDISWGRAGPS